MGLNEDQILGGYPRQGRFVLEDGTIVNLADLLDKARDSLSGAIAVEEYPHKRNHEGFLFDFSKKFSIPANSTTYLLGRTNGKQAHLFGFRIKGTAGDVDIELREAPTISDVGTSETPISRNRWNVQATTIEVYSGATVSDDGTLLYTTGLVAGSGAQAKAAQDADDPREWVLATATDYVYKLTNNAASDVTVLAEFDWYEVEP